MRRVPFVFKFALSSAAAYWMCSRLWDSNIYEAELYQVALNYREKFDKEYMKPAILPSQQLQQALIEESGKENKL